MLGNKRNLLTFVGVLALFLAVVIAKQFSDSDRPASTLVTPSPSASISPAAQDITEPNSIKPRNVKPTLGSNEPSITPEPNFGGKSSPSKLPAIASASYVLDEIRAELNLENINCTVVNPTAKPLLKIPGSVQDDTLAGCVYGNPTTNGFALYVATEPNYVADNNDLRSISLYQNFQSPLIAVAPSTFFTPSQRAIIFVAGGDAAFKAHGLAWQTLDSLGFNPPSRN